MSSNNGKNYHLNALLQISLAINDSLELPDVLTQVAFYTRALAESNQAIILLWNGRRNKFEIGASTLPDMLNLETDGLVKIAKRILDNSFSLQQQNDTNDDIELANFRSFIGVPIHHAGIGLGVIFALCHQPSRFHEYDAGPLKALANMAAIGIRNARLVGSLREINEIKSSIMGGTAHDLTEPLDELNDNISQLTTTLIEPTSEQIEAWQRINQSIVKMQQQVASLQKYERLTKATSYEPYPCDLNRIVQIVAREFQGAAAVKSQRFIISLVGQSLIVYGDQLLLRDAIGTFVNRAIERSKLGQPIQLATSITENHYIILIQDTGESLTAEEKKYLSHTFIQRENGISTPESGLSLQLVKRIVEQHGGSIDISTDSGNEICLLFPKEGLPAIPVD